MYMDMDICIYIYIYIHIYITSLSKYRQGYLWPSSVQTGGGTFVLAYYHYDDYLVHYDD